MAVNKNALIRYKTIDKCLQNHYRKWTLEDLIDACSDALYEYEGIDKGVSRRTVQADIQIMRSDKLGYNAPIIVEDRKYYTYEDREYSITNIPISEHDLDKMSEVVEFLKQFHGFSHFRELDGMVQKLEDHVYSQKTKREPVIDFEKNENLKGIEFLETLYQSIIRKEPIEMTYQSFRARTPSTFTFHGYLLKEFRNRWFIIGCKEKKRAILNLALDRIIKIEKSEEDFLYHPKFSPQTYFEDVIGVSVSPEMEATNVKFFVTNKHAPYVLTKPFHKSQRLVEKNYYGMIFEMNVQLNFELEKEILGLGDGIRVISPDRLRDSIRKRLRGGLDLYRTQLTQSTLEGAKNQLMHRGSAILNNVYTLREVNKIKSRLNTYFKTEKNTKIGRVHAQRSLLHEIPDLWELLKTENLVKIVHRIDKEAFLTKAIFFNKTTEADWFVTLHQDLAISVAKDKSVEEGSLWKKKKEGYYGWTKKEHGMSVCPPEEIGENRFTIRIHLDDTAEKNGALKVIHGSHRRTLADEEIQVIRENSVPYICEVGQGGVHLLKPLILHSSSKNESGKKRGVIHLEFASKKLGKGLRWKEKQKIEA